MGPDPLRSLDDPDHPVLTMSQAADLLGVKRTTLVEKIKRLERLGLGDGLQ